MDRNEVRIAFEILLEEVELVCNAIIRHGAQAMEERRFEEAKQAIELGVRLEEFRARVKAMQSEWDNLFATRLPSREKPSGIAERFQGGLRTTEDTVTATRPNLRSRLQRGLRTSEHAFRRPILEALVQLGGAGRIDQVLEIVEKKMKNVLNEYDYMPLPSDPALTRWKNTAQWCRATMVQEGLLKADSPRGVWEISEKGWEQVRREDV